MLRQHKKGILETGKKLKKSITLNSDKSDSEPDSESEQEFSRASYAILPYDIQDLETAESCP